MRKAARVIPLICLAGACAAGPLDGEWSVRSVGGQPLGATETPAFLGFDAAASRLYGSGGCNRLMAVYTAEGDALDLGEIATTMMLCAVMEPERRLLAALSGVRAFRSGDADLRLLDSEGRVLVELERRE